MKNPQCPRCRTRLMSRNGMTPQGQGRTRRVRWICTDRTTGEMCYTTTDPSKPPRDQAGRTDGAPARFNRALKGVRRVIVTSAQNATPVHAEFLASLQVAAKHLDAELVVIPLRYKNPTSRWTASQANAEEWAPEVQPFLLNQRKRLNENLMLLADVKVQPTASQPLTGFEGMTHGESAIMGHTKLQFRTVATPQSRWPKILTTTGACTVANYTDSKAGKLGEFHHTLGAVLVELQGKRFNLRQLLGESASGHFFDLDTCYMPQGTAAAGGCEALVMGDTHVDFIDPGVQRATFGKGGMIELLRPQRLVWHDLLDGYAANPHHYGNPFNAIAKRGSGRDDVEAEVQRAIDFVGSNTPKGVESVIVASNHDDFLRRWVVNTDWRQDPTNAAFYLKCAAAMVRGTKLGDGGTEYPSPFAMLAREALKARVLGGNESYSVAGIELGMHGDRGPNGARGSVKNLRRIGVKSIVGHSHSPAIEEGCYQVGTSTRLRLEYNGGPSSWLNTHCVIYPNGKRSLINIIDGVWRT
jgi:hypothetical protein